MSVPVWPPFFLAAVFLALGAAGVVPIENGSEGKRLVLGLMSLVFLGLGSALVFGRRWLTLDTGTGSLIRRYGLFIPMKNRERSLGNFSAVVIAFELDADSPDRYPVRLKARSKTVAG